QPSCSSPWLSLVLSWLVLPSFKPPPFRVDHGATILRMNPSGEPPPPAVAMAGWEMIADAMISLTAKPFIPAASTNGTVATTLPISAV
ncbi:hypothetical protein BGZ76_010888, partial [Entomortierella beljakovae]